MNLPQPENTGYRKITKRNAEAFFIDCMKVKEDRINWIRVLAASKGARIEKLDFSRESLGEIWTYLHSSVRRLDVAPFQPEDCADKPEWFSYRYPIVATRENDTWSSAKGGYDILSIWIMDGLAYYFGEVFVRNFEHITWKSYVHPRYEMSGMPHILSEKWERFNVCPWQQAATAMVRTWLPGQTVNPMDFVKAYDAILFYDS